MDIYRPFAGCSSGRWQRQWHVQGRLCRRWCSSSSFPEHRRPAQDARDHGRHGPKGQLRGRWSPEQARCADLEVSHWAWHCHELGWHGFSVWKRSQKWLGLVVCSKIPRFGLHFKTISTMQFVMNECSCFLVWAICVCVCVFYCTFRHLLASFGQTGEDLASHLLQRVASCSRRASGAAHGSPLEPKGQPWTHDANHVRNLQCSSDVCGYPGSLVPVCFWPHHRNRNGQWGWCQPYGSHLWGLCPSPCDFAIGPGWPWSHGVHDEDLDRAWLFVHHHRRARDCARCQGLLDVSRRKGNVPLQCGISRFVCQIRSTFDDFAAQRYYPCKPCHS